MQLQANPNNETLKKQIAAIEQKVQPKETKKKEEDLKQESLDSSLKSENASKKEVLEDAAVEKKN
jgi:hypothetical protein